MPGFRESLISHARLELDAMKGAKEPGASKDQSGKKTELATSLIRKYWMDGVNYSVSAANSEINKRTAWSAAFVSYCVRQALKDSGDTATFDFSASHSVYIGQSMRNDFAGIKQPAFFGEPATGIGKAKPMPGDIVGWSRTANIDSYDDALAAARHLPKPRTYYSHCDIVVEVAGGKVRMIGGNVSNTVKVTEVALDADGCMPVRQFRYDAAGRILSGPFIVVIQHR